MQTMRVIKPGCRTQSRAKILYQSWGSGPQWYLIEIPQRRRRKCGRQLPTQTTQATTIISPGVDVAAIFQPILDPERQPE